MATSRGYHHGDLRAALIGAALAAAEAGGPEAVSLRDLAQSLGVSTAAPYRHFPDRRALLAEVAALGFRELEQAYARAQADAPDARAALRETARAYLTLAFGRPGLFRMMFAGDLVDAADAPASLLSAAREAWEGLYRAVAAADPGADLAEVKRRAITGWSTLHGFIVLVQGGRLKGFMTEPLTEAELLEAVLEKTLTAN
ncbi:TetR/AcrR family transcriptional regulator [Phenylobacterium sp.]|uniref:TetR/AcrR family transcriptional regulator n=1 Tax=Phenylobacterium sp. TaxID=1871053 RepID=UPI0012238873|nr:TetR/AcrR family transcriptional regulator [Phenylobacterium sp.]THD57906.1 MAG: TetR/AcrR family transcriptional regulator [Phenylobacterium sp.]